MRALVGLLAWLAIRAGADIGPPGQRWGRASFVGTATRIAQLGPSVRPDKAGRLVPIPEEALGPDRSFVAHWALLAAVALVVLIVAWGYLRRRWKARAKLGGSRLPWPAWGRDSGRKG
jgi:hypothetical protein